MEFLVNRKNKTCDEIADKNVAFGFRKLCFICSPISQFRSEPHYPNPNKNKPRKHPLLFIRSYTVFGEYYTENPWYAWDKDQLVHFRVLWGKTYEEDARLPSRDVSFPGVGKKIRERERENSILAIGFAPITWNLSPLGNWIATSDIRLPDRKLEISINR